jgi:hypothetical protein
VKSQIALQPRRALCNIKSGFEVLKGLRQVRFRRADAEGEQGLRCQAWVVPLKYLLMNLPLDVETSGDAARDALS